MVFHAYFEAQGPEEMPPGGQTQTQLLERIHLAEMAGFLMRPEGYDRFGRIPAQLYRDSWPGKKADETKVKLPRFTFKDVIGVIESTSIQFSPGPPRPVPMVSTSGTDHADPVNGDVYHRDEMDAYLATLYTEEQVKAAFWRFRHIRRAFIGNDPAAKRSTEGQWGEFKEALEAK